MKRRPRKKKEIDPNAPPAPPKEKKPRKPRTSAVGTGRATKKQKVENDASVSIVSQNASPATNLGNSRLVQPTTFVSENSPPNIYEAAKITQNGFSNPNPAMNSQPQSPSTARYSNIPQPQLPAPRVRNVFDPVRGIERAEQPYQPPTSTPPRPTFRPSASPAISSIINPPDLTESKPSLYHITSSQLDSGRDGKVVSNGNIPSRPMTDVVSAAEAAKKASVIEKPATETESKPKRAKEHPPPAPVGSGLLNSTFFGGDSSSENQIGKGVNIVLQIDLSKEENKIFNFSRMAEEKYGFAAVYPRQAAQKERLAKVAAAGAALERAGSNGKRGELSMAESGDEDLSVDIDRDSDNDGDVNMTGLNGTNENSGTDGPAVRQRKKRKDEYDADDPFVDDSEALWEAQAAASKDGFFVYMGALVTEEKGTSEKSDGPAKRGGGRGRGRGGGPGSRGGRGAASSATGEGVSRGGGPGSRGGGTTRKPRITKQERQLRELEKKQREQAGSALATKVAAAPV